MDFPRDVREKRKGLLGMLRSYQQDKIEAALVFDKLLTPDGVFTFDTEFKQIKQISGPRPGYTHDANSKQQHVDSATRADSPRDHATVACGRREQHVQRAVSKVSGS